MRSTIEKLPLLAAGVVLSAVLASTTSCGGGPASRNAGPCLSEEYANRPPETVSVIVTFDPNRKSADTPNKWVILRGGKDSIQWTSPDGVVDVDFGKETPFGEPPALDEKKKIRKSKPALPVTARKVLEYKAYLTLTTDPTKVVEVDPRVEIWP
ncbi:MAG: hypothetical protein ACHQPI_09885 [Thermoanaerobaculia bacterium]